MGCQGNVQQSWLLVLKDPCSRLSALGYPLPGCYVRPGEASLAVVGSVSRLALQVLTCTAQLQAHICHCAVRAVADTVCPRLGPMASEVAGL